MHDPISDKFQKTMNDLARLLDSVLNGDQRPKPNGFVLLTFEFGKLEGGRVNYIGNGEREDVKVAMKELLARWDGQPEIKGKA